MIKIRAAGCCGEQTWDYKGRDVAQIFISLGDVIQGIQFQFVDENGNLVLSDPHGIMAPPQFHTVKLKYPSEYITLVSGYSSDVWAGGVSCIEFGTNKARYGPFGTVGKVDERFEFHLGQNRQFGGFHGTCDKWNLKSIGVYVKPALTLTELTLAVNEVEQRQATSTSEIV